VAEDLPRRRQRERLPGASAVAGTDRYYGTVEHADRMIAPTELAGTIDKGMAQERLCIARSRNCRP
jgi:hypothetical protein